MRTLNKLAFLLEDFSPGSPAQHLVDRFLMGYARDGEFHKPGPREVSAYVMMTNEGGFDKRAEDFGLRVASTAEQAVDGADAVVVVSRKPGVMANDRLLKIALERAAEGAACFVHGALSSSLALGREAITLARSRKISLLAGSALNVTHRLPAIEVPAGTALSEALIVVQINQVMAPGQSGTGPGTLGGAELNALGGLLPIIERRAGGESGIRSIRWLEGDDVWKAGDKGLWSRPLLAAALSRSNSPQGDPVLDGRTQDIFGLGLVRKLALQPVAWQLAHHDGLKTTILVLDGVVNDFNFAVGARDGRTFSAQLFRAPPPVEQHYGLLMATIEDFLRGGASPWRVERNLLIAGLLETFRRPLARSGRVVETPDLGLAY